MWDEAETEQKRQYVRNLVANAGGLRVCRDDTVRLFVSWLSTYHETHFAIITEIHRNPGSTRYEIWSAIYGEELPSEDGPEADLYRMLIRDLSIGGVIRQARTHAEAREWKREGPRRRRPFSYRSTPTHSSTSAFDDEEQYVLTELGKQFVHYTLIGDVRRMGAE